MRCGVFIYFATTFKNGELGAIYTEYRYADSNEADAIGDAGNNKT